MEFSATLGASNYTTNYGTGYDAAKASKRRKTVVNRLSSEDDKLKETPRKNLTSQTRDLRRNVVVARWIIARHLDFVCSHRFEPQTGSDTLNRRLTDFVYEATKKENFDALGKHSLGSYLRIAEGSCLVDGDNFSIKMRDGTLQAREADLLRDPRRNTTRRTKENWVQGIRLDERLRPAQYAFHKRAATGYELDRTVNANSVIPLGYYDRFDQYRGVAPLAASVNLIRDFYENIDYTSAKSKLASLFGFKLTRDGYADPEDDGEGGGDRSWDLSKGIEFFDLDPGEDIDFLFVDTPGANQQSFFDMLVSLSLKSLDIPFSFWKEDYTNFFGNKIAFTIYQNSCKPKRKRVRDFLNDWLCWRLELARGREIRLPLSFRCDPREWAWHADGLPWFDAKDLNADLAAISAGIKSREDVCQERLNKSWERDVLPQIVKEANQLKEAGLTTSINLVPTGEPTNEEQNESGNTNEDN